MIKFLNNQTTFNIGRVKFGGQPGKRRVVLIGSIFYPRHSIVLDRINGIVKPGSVEMLLEQSERASLETGCPYAIMIYGETKKAIRNYLEIISDLFSGPIFIDSPSAEVRIAGINWAKEAGIEDRIVYNTINAGIKPEEWEALENNNIQNAVILAFNPGDLQSKGKIYLLENGSNFLPEGLIELAKKHGITRPLLDMAVMSYEQGAGHSIRAIMIAKAKWGFPTGCAIHNAVESYPLLTKIKNEDKKIFNFVDVAATVIPIMTGADFLIYGPIEYARRMMYAATFADALLEQSASEIW
ncbi:MAG: hypothetical protein QW520_07065 [Methanomassiliicoccales archaeon]